MNGDIVCRKGDCVYIEWDDRVRPCSAKWWDGSGRFPEGRAHREELLTSAAAYDKEREEETGLRTATVEEFLQYPWAHDSP